MDFGTLIHLAVGEINLIAGQGFIEVDTRRALRFLDSGALHFYSQISQLA